MEHLWRARVGNRATTGTVIHAFRHARALSTNTHYEASVKRFLRWCTRERVTPWFATEMDVVHYFADLARGGAINFGSPGSIRPIRAALNAYFEDYGQPALLRNSRLIDLMIRGCARLQVDTRPPQQTIVSLPAEVAFNVYQRLSVRMPPKHLRAALFMLLLYMTISRPVSIVTLRTEDVEVTDTEIRVRRMFTKTSLPNDTRDIAPGRTRLMLPRQRFPELATAILQFTYMRHEERENAQYFFELEYRDCFTTANAGDFSSQWMQQAIAQQTLTPTEGTIWRPKSARRGAASAARVSGMPLHEIEARGGWGPHSSTLRAVYFDAAIQRSCHTDFFFKET